MNVSTIDTLAKSKGPASLVLAAKPDQKLILGGCALEKTLTDFLDHLLQQSSDNDEILSSFLSTETSKHISHVTIIKLKETQLEAKQYNQVLQKAYDDCKKINTNTMVSLLTHVNVKGLQLEDKVIKNATIAAASFYSYKSNNEQVMLRLLHKKNDAHLKNAVKQALAVMSGVDLTKMLGNTPPNICTPSFMAKQAQQLAKEHSNLTATIIDEAGMKKLGMGALLAVSQGSNEPAKFIVMEYKGAAKSQQPIVLVGKGVTFDSGGTSLKPPPAMIEMKYDMLGAASVFGTLKALCEMKAKKNVVVITPCTENMPGSKALKPGDVIKSMAGIDIEVLNTDAEGRLILCDALCYAKKFNPQIVIDLATLTGAAVMTFGHHTQPVMGNAQKLVEQLIKSFNRLGEQTWQLPLFEEYNKELNSKVADITNIAAVNPRLGGTIHSGCFLSRFCEEYQWAHIDIAGTAFNSRQLATGRPVAALIDFVLNYAG